MIRIELPWPDKRLSPNSRTHWRAKAEATKKARGQSRMLTVSVLQIPQSINWVEGARLKVAFTFYPGDKRRRDIDNLISSTKAHRDGIADALGMDDSKFILSAQIGEIRKPACVVVEIT